MKEKLHGFNAYNHDYTGEDGAVFTREIGLICLHV